uniref:Uncharacterized protein n=1 Tax=Romanomermis culicivorax TaxID=13658 RepID=A0A915HSL4_ROMCU
MLSLTQELGSRPNSYSMWLSSMTHSHYTTTAILLPVSYSAPKEHWYIVGKEGGHKLNCTNRRGGFSCVQYKEGVNGAGTQKNDAKKQAKLRLGDDEDQSTESPEADNASVDPALDDNNVQAVESATSNTNAPGPTGTAPVNNNLQPAEITTNPAPANNNLEPVESTTPNKNAPMPTAPAPVNNNLQPLESTSTLAPSNNNLQPESPTPNTNAPEPTGSAPVNNNLQPVESSTPSGGVTEPKQSDK